MSHVNLFLDNYEFYSGSSLKGKAVCYFRDIKEIRKIRIRLRGEESTYWTGQESYYDSVEKKHKSRTVHYHGKRDFLVKDKIVHGEGTVSAGQHVFPFEFFLSENIPGTFQHTNGRIKFSVTVTVDRPWKSDYESETEITVISPIRLQTLSSSFLRPAELSDEKTVCCLCCASGPVQIDVSLEKKAFVVGENAGVKVYCMNMSNRSVDSLVAEIRMKLIFKATHPSHDHKYDSELITVSHNSGVGAHGEKNYNLKLKIPPSAVVPNFTGCQLFSTETQLVVNALISGCHTDLAVATGIALGHVPCSPSMTTPPESVSRIQPMPMPLPGYEAVADNSIGFSSYPVPPYSSGPSAPQETGAPSAPPKSVLAGATANFDAGNSTSFELPPPTYDEAAKNFQ